MTPDERDRVNELFDKLETLERSPRERDAERVIAEGLQRAPHAAYALVQTVLVQDEALKQADARIRALQAELGGDGQPRRESGFLDNMRDTIFGAPRRSSVPSVRPGDAPMGAPRVWGNAPQQQQPAQQEPQQGIGRGSSFLGTAAASAAGMIGGYMLMNSLGGMFGGGHAHAAHDKDAAGSGSPWGGGGDASNSGLAKDAGLNDMGSGERRGFFDDAGQGGGDSGGADFGGDYGGGGGGD